MDVDHLASLDPDKDYAVPESRVKNAGAIRARIGEMKQADLTRSERRATIQGNINGNRPYNQQRLKETGQGDRTNLNVREGEGMADAAKGPYYSLIFRVPRFANIQCRYGTNKDRNSEWSDKISNRFHTMLDNWTGYDNGTQLYQWQMCVFGIGLPVWEDELSPFWKSRKIGDVLVPDETEADIEMLDEAVILRKVSPIQLYQWIKNEKAAKAQGWLVDRVKKAIVKVTPQDLQSQFGKAWSEKYQDSLRRGDVLWNNKAMRIPLADYLVKEFPGKISHCIMLDGGAASDTGTRGTAKSIMDEDDESLIFRKKDRFDCFSQVMCPFFFDVGTGEWHSVKGLGPKIHDFCEVSNRQMSTLLDASRVINILQPKDAATSQETQLVHINGMTVAPAGYDVIKNNLSSNLDGPILVRREMQNIQAANTGQFTQRNGGTEFAPTLGQDQLNVRQQSVLNEAAIDRVMKTLDRFYDEMVRRTLKWGVRLFGRKPNNMTKQEKLVHEFYRGCIEEDGIPEQALVYDNIVSVKAVRGFGGGSPVNRDMAAQRGMAMLPVLNERGRNIVKRIALSELFGQSSCDEIEPPFEDADVPDNNEWAAWSENNAMREMFAEPPPLTPDQDDVVHFKVHFQGAMRNLEMLKQGVIEPQMALMILHNFGPHMKKHIDRMIGDPTREQQIKPMLEGWQMLSKVADQLQQQVEEAAKAEEGKAQQPQIDPEMMLKLAEIQGNLKLKEMKMQGDLALKAQKQAATLRMQDVKTAHGMRTETLKATQTEPELAVA